MNRSTMRDTLERQLQDDSNQIFSVANLDQYLNQGLQFMQTAVLQSDPEAFQEISTAPTTAADDGYDDLYAKPQGLMQIVKVELDLSGSGTYTQAFKRYNYQIDAFVNGSETTSLQHWSTKGRWLRIYPTPTVVVAAGIRLTFVPTLTMGADTDVPDLHIHLHKAIILAARMDALADTDEDVDPNTLDTLTKKLAIIIDRVPLYYSQSHGEPDVFDPDINAEDGWV